MMIPCYAAAFGLFAGPRIERALARRRARAYA